jgi:hypothetical protein
MSELASRMDVVLGRMRAARAVGDDGAFEAARADMATLAHEAREREERERFIAEAEAAAHANLSVDVEVDATWARRLLGVLVLTAPVIGGARASRIAERWAPRLVRSRIVVAGGRGPWRWNGGGAW